MGVDWLDPTKASVMIALENASAMPKRSKDETEESVFLVKLTAELPTDLHSPLRLARRAVVPLQPLSNYPAMGHNGGVVKLGSVASRVVLVRPPGRRVLYSHVLCRAVAVPLCAMPGP